VLSQKVAPHKLDSGSYPSGVYVYAQVAGWKSDRVNTVKCCPQRELTAGDLGSEGTEKRGYLWPEPIEHTQSYMKPKVESLKFTSQKLAKAKRSKGKEAQVR
jgi:hypothetical protein